MATKTAMVKRLQGITFAGLTDTNHWVMMDGPAEFGGSDAAIRPKEMLLLALGGCTSADLVSILTKRRVQLTDYEVRLTAEQTETHPQVYTKVHVEYRFRGRNLQPKDIELAIEMSRTKYCGVWAMLRPAVEITHEYAIEEDE